MSVVANAQAPWPLERQNRWGTGTAVVGPDPATFTTPWISNRLAYEFPVSHGASLGENGIGYFGDWVDNKVFKFNYNTGAILQAFQADSFVACVPAIGPSPYVIASTEGGTAKLFGIDTTIMDFQWFKTTGYVGGSPNIGPEGDTAFGTAGGTVYRLHVGNGATVWSHPGLGTVNGSTVFTRDDSKIIVSNGSSVTALNWADGTTAWTVNYGTTMFKAGVAPNGTIVIGSQSGTIYGLDSTNGSVLWTWTALDKVTGGPGFSPDGTVAYVPSVDGRIYALRVSDGLRLWSYSTSSWCEHAPSVGADGRIYVHNKASDLYCLSPAGTLIWQVRLNGEARGPMTIGPDGTLYVGFTGSHSGLAMVRQQGISLQPETFSIDHGTLVSGGLADALASDNSYIEIKPDYSLTRTEPPVRMVFTLHTPYKPISQLTISLETGVRVMGLICYTELWNGTAWEQVDTRIVPPTDLSYKIPLSSASRFADSTGLIKCRVSFKEGASGASLRWNGRLDYIHFDLVPQFVP